ncbi:ABC transporter, partial [Mesorhizobium sp. M8A.F.Ca.ET.059.01.1.1]
SGAIQARTALPSKGGGKWDLYIGGIWLSPSASDLLVLGQKGVRHNRAYWQNAKFDELADEVAKTAQLEKSQQLVDEAVRLIYREAPYIMLAYPFMLDARRKDCFQSWGTDDLISMWGYFPFDRMKAR